MTDFVAALVDETILSNWMQQFECGERSLWEMNLLTITQELNISQNAFIEANNAIGNLYTDDQINALYSNDIKKVNECFANPYSLVVDGEIYTPDWLATHTSEDYLENGISFNDLEIYLRAIDIPDLNFACVPIAFNAKELNSNFDLSSVVQLRNLKYDPALFVIDSSTKEMLSEKEYEAWISQFLVENNSSARSFSEFNIINMIYENNLSPEKTDNKALVTTALKANKVEDILKSYLLSEQLSKYAITKNNIAYSVEWIATKTIDEITSKGITTDDLQELMNDMQYYCFTAEYEWIKSCYDRMISDS